MREGPRDPERLVFEADAALGEEIRGMARLRGQSPETLAVGLLERGLAHEVQRTQVQAALSALTPREQQVARLVARGWTNRRIALALVVSPETVKTHVAHVLEKLGVHSKVDLQMLLLDLRLRWWQVEESG